MSKSLVSLALRGDTGVSDSTRQRIAAEAARLGYRHNAVARALVQGRTSLIGAVATDLSNPYHSEVVTGIENAAEEGGYSVLIGHGRRDRERVTRRVESMIELNVDGIIVVSSWADPLVLRAASRHVPVVVVGRMPERVDGIDTIVSDDAHGMSAAVRHLVDNGYVDIAFVSSSTRPAAEARRRGFLSAIGSAEGAVTGRAVELASPGDTPSIERLLDADCPSAIIANNDVTAVRVMDVALDRGIRIPDDLAVVGYDNTMLAELVRPGLTSIDQPNDEIGQLAMRLITERMEGRAEDRHEVIAPHVIVRASSAPRPAV